MLPIDRRAMLGLLGGTAIAPFVRAAPAERAALAADIGLLRRLYETLHPGLYRYQTPDEFARRVTDLQAALAGPMTLARQYLTLSRLLAQIRCGHTYANFFNQSKPVAQRLIEPANKLPFLFVWSGGRMIVTGNPLMLDGIRPGDEILSVDGVPAAAIQARLLPLIRADGSNDAKRRVLLDVTGSDRIESFDVYHPLVFPNDSGRFALDLVRPGGERRRIGVTAIDQAAREAMSAAGPDIATPEYWTLAWPRPAVALITMPGWAMYEVKWDWRQRIARIFEAIASRGASGLVIDLRDNEGGNDCGNEIIARLIDQDLPLFQDYDRLVRFRSTPEDLNPYLDTWDRSFEHLGEGAEDVGHGFYRLKADDDTVRRIAPEGPRFKGNVIVLSSAQNSSATFGFIQLIRQAGLARIYGQPTGGNQRGINGGSFFFVRLPETGLEADLPLVGTFPRQPKPDAGLDPDVRIDRQPEDIAAGRDPVLERALLDLA